MALGLAARPEGGECVLKSRSWRGRRLLITTVMQVGNQRRAVCLRGRLQRPGTSPGGPATWTDCFLLLFPQEKLSCSGLGRIPDPGPVGALAARAWGSGLRPRVHWGGLGKGRYLFKEAGAGPPIPVQFGQVLGQAQPLPVLCILPPGRPGPASGHAGADRCLLLPAPQVRTPAPRRRLLRPKPETQFLGYDGPLTPLPSPHLAMGASLGEGDTQGRPGGTASCVQLQCVPGKKGNGRNALLHLRAGECSRTRLPVGMTLNPEGTRKPGSPVPSPPPWGHGGALFLPSVFPELRWDPGTLSAALGLGGQAPCRGPEGTGAQTESPSPHVPCQPQQWSHLGVQALLEKLPGREGPGPVFLLPVLTTWPLYAAVPWM